MVSKDQAIGLITEKDKGQFLKLIRLVRIK